MLPLKIRLSAGAISVICLKIDRPPPEFVRPLASVPGHRRFEGDEAPVAAQPIWISHNSQKHGEIRLGKVLFCPPTKQDPGLSLWVAPLNFGKYVHDMLSSSQP